MHRRAYLGTIAASVVALPGCFWSSTDYDVSDRPLSEYDCPPDGVSPARLPACSHSIRDDTPKLVLSPSPDVTAELSNVDLTLRNAEPYDIRINPGAWKGWVERSGSWEKIDDRLIIDGFARLEPGDTLEWSASEAIGYINNGFDPSVGTYFLVFQDDTEWAAALFRITGE